MKLFAVAIVVYAVQFFLLPYVAVQAASALPLDARTMTLVAGVLPTALIAALGAYMYARWTKTPLGIAHVLAVGFIFLAVPGIWYLATFAVAYFRNAVDAVANAQGLIMPLFDAYQRYGAMYFAAQFLVWTPTWAPYILGPAIASFFIRAQAVTEVRFIGDSDEDSGILKL